MRPREFLPRAAFDLPSDSRDAFGRGADRLLAATRSRFGLREPVGEGRPNRPEDVATVERLLDRAGQPPFRSDREPSGLFSAPLRDSVRGFQRRNGLRDDGVVDPDGETFNALTNVGLDDPEDGATLRSQPASGELRQQCVRIDVRLKNLSRQLDRIEDQIEEDRLELKEVVDRVRAAEVALPTAIANAVLDLAGAIAARNLRLAVLEAIELAARLSGTNTELNVASDRLNAIANALSFQLDRRDQTRQEINASKDKSDRLGCSSVSR